MPNAFTEERKGIVNVLSTKCGVSEAISVEELIQERQPLLFLKML